MRDKLVDAEPGGRKRGIRWIAGTTDHCCPVCGLLHSIPASLASPAELRAFRARLGRTLKLPPGQLLSQGDAAKLLGCHRDSLVGYETGELVASQAVSERMRECLERYAGDAAALRRVLGIAEPSGPQRPLPRARNAAPFHNI